MSILWHIACLLLLRSCTPGFFIHGIVGGKVSVPYSQPYMVYIRDKVSKEACGGFLVRKDLVMTAAHCKQSDLMVYLGVSDTNLLPNGIEVDPILHPEFTMMRAGHDIMLLKLKTPATLNKIVSTITLPKTENEEISKNCMVMGWGWKKYCQESPSNALKEANVNLIDSENCDTADTLCTEGSTGPGLRDSGGPLVCGGVAQGIVLFSKNKANANHLTVYTNISHYLTWIHQTMMSSEIPKMLDQVSRPGTLDPTPGRWTPKPDNHQVLSGFCMQDAIIGGKVLVPHSRPYMVYIRDKLTNVTCGGFLVREDFVMTAAHCKQRHLMVYLGVDDTSLLPDGVEVDPFPHPEFKRNKTGHDIMLLKLKTPATLNKTVSTIILLKPKNEKLSKHCMVMGWGWKKYHHESPSNVLKEATVTLIDSENCGTADTLCTEGSTGPARRDSGGPLVCGGVAQGIVSFYKNNTDADHLTVYTHISHYFTWIHRTMMSSEIPKMLDQVSWPRTCLEQVLSGAKVSVPHRRPYMVYIRDKVSKVSCGGFLVREDFVMTAAHCKQRHLMVYLGVDNTNILPDGIEVDPIPHPEFSMKRPDHDIMLLKLKTPATLNKTVSTITLPKTENEEISKDCMVMGWGWQDYNNMSPSNVLKEANVNLIDSENCGTADTLCTEGSTGPARGDSGVPLVCGGVAQGISSYYKNKGKANHLSVYTQISHYLPWINHTMLSRDMAKRSDQVSTQGTLDPTPGRWTPKPVLSGGKVSVPHSRPYMVYIRDKYTKVACGGFLVKEDYVMTAAHCKQSHLMVYLGVNDTNLLPDGVEVDPIPHPEYNMKKTGHDIMLLKLKTPATLNLTVNTITFPNTENKEFSKNCMVWGWMKYHDESPSNVLKEANVTLIDSENCGTADTLCTEGSTGPAQGHSGGPLVCGGVAQGIVSFYKNNKNGDHLTVYTNISHYLSWIYQTMKY